MVSPILAANQPISAQYVYKIMFPSKQRRGPLCLPAEYILQTSSLLLTDMGMNYVLRICESFTGWLRINLIPLFMCILDMTEPKTDHIKLHTTGLD